MISIGTELIRSEIVYTAGTYRIHSNHVFMPGMQEYGRTTVYKGFAVAYDRLL